MPRGNLMARPQAKTIRNVVAHLNEMGLFVYGQCTNLETGQAFPSNMDFDADDIIKYRRMLEKDEIWMEGED
jgi:hypothetical protein